MSNLFFYQREVKRKVKVPIENLDDKPGADFVEQEVVETYWDCFNIDKVVRGHWTNPDEFTILLDDGHEQADFVEKPIFAGGKLKRIDRVKERAWFASQIPLKREDAERLMSIVGHKLT